MVPLICGIQVGLAVFALVVGLICPQLGPLARVVLSSFFVVVASVVWLFVRYLLVSIRKTHRYSQLARSFLSINSEVDEVFVLDDHLDVLFSKTSLSQEGPFVLEKNIGPLEEMTEGALDSCERALQEGLYFEDVFLFQPERPSDEPRYLRVRVLPLFTTSFSTPSYRAVVISDVTLLQARMAKQESPTLLERYLSQAPFGLVYIDQKGTLLGANDVVRQWVRGPLLGQSVTSLLATALPLRTILDTQQGLEVELKGQRGKMILWATPMSATCWALTLFQPSEGVHTNPPDVLESLPLPSLTVDSDGKVQTMNTALRALLAKQNAHLIEKGRLFTDGLDDPSRKRWANALHSVGLCRKTFELHFDNSDFTVMAAFKKWGTREGLIQFMDTSEQKKLEQQFAQAQKTQAVGQLAGGIAHDFNNLLTAIIGFCDLLLLRILPNDPSFVDIMHIKQNANRAANLVKQLLAFSRRQSLQPRRINVAEVMSDLSALLRRLIGSQIEFRLHQNRHLWPVKADVGQFEQVIINLVVNARDAMESGGVLTLETSNTTNKVTKNFGNDMMPPGDYVLISVKDTGTGIAPEVMKSIFEPFFSTKPKGQGTGLGLATVYGIVKQTGGAIDVESRLGEGATFKVYLPRCREANEVTPPEKKRITDVTGSETILLVEDEDAVRIFASRALRDKGYRVLEASNGREALALLNDGAKPNILVTDVSMPDMDGPVLSQRVKALLPQLPVIFMSGYAEETFRQDLSQNQDMHFLMKPFTLRDLASKVRDILGHQPFDNTAKITSCG